MTMVDKVRVSDWRDVRRAAVTAGGITEVGIAVARRERLDEVRARRLVELRLAQHLTQQELADAMTVARPRVSQLERGDLSHSEVGTIRAYVEALGGHLRMVADFGDQVITIE
jgi:predicted XRE-type DNA-binding protein